MLLKGKIVGLLLACLCMPAMGQSLCFEQAAAYYQVPAVLLRAIAKHESDMDPQQVHINRNGSKDIGLMQINEMWLPKIAPMGITRQDLYDGCVNTFVGAWILAQNMRKAETLWEAVGAYNAGWRDTPARQKRRARYIASIRKIVQRLQQSTEARS